MDPSLSCRPSSYQGYVANPENARQAADLLQVFGLLLNITIGFCIRDIDAALASPFGNPVAQVIFDSQGRNAALAMWVSTDG